MQDESRKHLQQAISIEIGSNNFSLAKLIMSILEEHSSRGHVRELHHGFSRDIPVAIGIPAIETVGAPALLRHDKHRQHALPTYQLVKDETRLQDLIGTVPAASAKRAVLPQSRSAFHSKSDWFDIIKDEYLDYLRRMGDDSFTAKKLMEWIESNINLTEADKDIMGDGKPRWRKQVSTALGDLANEGVIFRRGQGSSTYSTVECHPAINVMLG